jgi:type VI secretion system secreted protein VgrG
MPSFSQDERTMAVETPLGKDKLLLQRLDGEEAVSKLFHFDLELLSEDPGLDFDAIVGKNVTVSLKLIDGSKRYLNGIVSHFYQGGCDSRFTFYRAQIVPWAWLLSLTTDCRIFQNMAAPDIIQKIFTDHGFQDYKNTLKKSYKPLEYCVQYRETDLNFVSRLMEEFGIFYFFQHESGKHTMILADTPDYQPCSGQSEAKYERSGFGTEQEDVITAWTQQQEVRSGKCSLTDYNFETPSNKLEVNVESIHPPAAREKFEIYDYPGRYLNRPGGEELVKIRIEEEEMKRLTARGTSNCRAFTSGYRFALTKHYRDDLNKSYVLLSVTHKAEEKGYVSGEEESFAYTNSFSCIRNTVPFRPPRRAEKPVVHGSQTAVVVGKSGEEIWVDNYGRVKVQFHWDREGKNDEKSSCWVRVSQPWAGKSWGGVCIPRIGQEVLVDFLEGDPDRPIITGRVYNAQQMPPYSLPANQTQSGLKSRSSKAGSASNFNELRFEDKKGQEQVFLQAEKDWVILVKNNENGTIGNNRTERIGHDESLTVGNDRTEVISNNETLTVGKNRSETIGIDHETTIGTNCTETVGNNHTLTVGARLLVTAGTEIKLVCGASSITMAPGAIVIKSPVVLATGQSLVRIRGTQVKAEGALVKIKGGMVKIN